MLQHTIKNCLDLFGCEVLEFPALAVAEVKEKAGMLKEQLVA